MKERAKKFLLNLSYRTAVAAGLFILVFVLSRTAESIFPKISSIWTKDTGLLKVTELLKELFKVLI